MVSEAHGALYLKHGRSSMLCKDMQGVRARGPTDRGGGAVPKGLFWQNRLLSNLEKCFAEGFC